MEVLVSEFQKFLLVFLRISGIFITAPLFSSPNIDYPIRVSICLLTSLAAAPPVLSFIPQPPTNIISYAILSISEIIIGLTIGLFASFIVSLFSLSAEFYSVSMGFAISNVFDPVSEVEQPVIGQLLGLFGLLVFITIDGPQTILYAVISSFKFVTGLSLVSSKILSSSTIEMFCKMFATALKISFPLLCVLFLVNLSLGLLSKAAPLINIMIFGFPITILSGLIVLFLLFPFLWNVSSSIFQELFSDIDKLIRSL
ncbi:MAG: flagellar biosynthetic protein FliR [bacterium]